MRIIECGSFAAAYAGRLFGDRGADVIKLEVPGGDASRFTPPCVADIDGQKTNAAFAYFNANKYFVTLDCLRQEGCKILESLCGAAELVLLEEPWSVELGSSGMLDRVLCAKPALVVVAATPFGLDGPYAEFQGTISLSWR